MPASVIAAVPPGWIRASAVWTCVCVPITAVTLAVEHARDGDLLARRLGVEVDEDDGCPAARLLDEPVEHLERAHGHLEEELPEDVADGHRRAVGRLDDGQAAPGRCRPRSSRDG